MSTPYSNEPIAGSRITKQLPDGTTWVSSAKDLHETPYDFSKRAGAEYREAVRQLAINEWRARVGKRLLVSVTASESVRPGVHEALLAEVSPNGVYVRLQFRLQSECWLAAECVEVLDELPL